MRNGIGSTANFHTLRATVLVAPEVHIKPHPTVLGPSFASILSSAERVFANNSAENLLRRAVELIVTNDSFRMPVESATTALRYVRPPVDENESNSMRI